MGAVGTMTAEEVGVCEREGALEEDLDSVALGGGEKGPVGERALSGEVAREGL